MSRRVVVTGVGLVSPLAIGTQANWDALLAGKSGIGPITRFDASQYSARIAGEVKDFDPLQFVDKKDVKKMDVFIQYAIAAAQFAMDDSGLSITPANATNVGVFIGSGIVSFIIAIPLIAAVLPLIFGAASNNTGPVWITVVCCALYFPILLLLSGILNSYVQSVWTLTYMRLTARPLQDNTPVIPEANA